MIFIWNVDFEIFSGPINAQSSSILYILFVFGAYRKREMLISKIVIKNVYMYT